MPRPIRRDSRRDYRELPELTPLLVEIIGAELRDSKTQYQRQPEDDQQHQYVALTMQVLEPAEYFGLYVWGNVSVSAWERSTYRRQLLPAILGRAATEEDVWGFDTDDLIGKRLVIIGQYKDEERRFLRPVTYGPSHHQPATQLSPPPTPQPVTTGPAPSTPAPSTDDDIDF
jgi:hypothetical protein